MAEGGAGAGRSAAKEAYLGLLSGSRWSGDVVTVGFPSSTAGYSYKTDGFGKFNAGQKAAVKDILASYESFSGINFAIKSNGAKAQIRLAETNSYGTAYGYYPSSKDKGGDVWVNKSKGWYDDPGIGNYAYFTLMHELGHALGLKHGHEGGGYGKMPSKYNGMPYSVMTYASYVGQRSLANYQNAWDSYAQTPMLEDIKALQMLYGANFKHNSGKTTYSWDPETGALRINGSSQGNPVGNRIFQTIWDGGGTDTYDLSDYSNGVIINLNPGSWSKFDPTQLANLSGNGSKLAPGNVANAYLYQNKARSLIENAVGGSGDDKIIGNGKGNKLIGGEGSDTLIGNDGNDVYITDGLDTIVERSGGGRDKVVSSADYTLGSHQEILCLVGTDDLKGYGNAARNDVYGNSGHNVLSGGPGADRLFGGLGDDTYLIDSFDAKDRIFETAAAGTDTVESAISFVLPLHVDILRLTGSAKINGVGNNLPNQIIGNSTANLLDGRDGDDMLTGAGGNDTLIGGTGIDTLSGGEGADEFRFLDVSHLGDTIQDFTPGADSLAFSRAIFGGAVTAITDDNFKLSAVATGSAPIILYDAQEGMLMYDADGAGAGEARLLCKLSNLSVLSASDILVL